MSSDTFMHTRRCAQPGGRLYRAVATMAFALTTVLLVPSNLWAAGKPTKAKPAVAMKAAEKAEAGQIISDTSGQLAEVLLHFDDDIEAELAPLYRDLFAALGDNVKIRVLCESSFSARQFAERWRDVATERNRDLDVVNVGMPLSIWARDRCIARTRGNTVQRSASFVPSANPYYEFEKFNDLRTQRMLYRGLLGPNVLRSWLLLEGGNVIANDKTVFIGANVAEENDCELPDPQLERELSRICGRKYTLIGAKADILPWDHCDMYMTPIDDDTILVASAKAGTRFVNQDCDPDAGEELNIDGIQAALDHVANEMRGQGYHVLRMPAVFGATGDWIMTYNNVIMERRNGCRIVLMPTYNVPEMDNAAAKAYRKLGFEVKPIDVSGVFEYGGAVRCIVNVVDRRPDQAKRTNPRRLAKARHGHVRVLDVSSFVPRRVTRVYGEDDDPMTEPQAMMASPQATRQ